MNPGTWKLGDDPLDDRPTFLAHALAMSLLHGPGPWPEDAQRLPDEPPRPDDGAPYVPSVVLDGVRTHHFGTTPDTGAVTRAADLLVELVTAEPAHADLVRLHDLLAAARAIDLADDLIAELGRRRPRRDRIRALGRHLAEHGTRREAVKIGLVLVGACGDDRDRDLLLLLGTLEEFTLYAVVALTRTQPDRQRAVYELARRVSAWGRIHAVERLKDCDDPEVKDWLLREGYRNGIMNEYLAHLAATTGDLYTALLEPDIDDELLDSAGLILTALAIGGPAEDMGDYAEAVPAMHRFADLLDGRDAGLVRLTSLDAVLRFLRDPGGSPPWPAEETERLLWRYERLAGQRRWRELVLTHLSDPHDPGFGTALWMAPALGVPMVEQAVARLESDPMDEWTWRLAIRHATPGQAERLCHLAGRLLPLAELVNGPGEHYGFGEECTADRALGSVVGGLDGFPRTGLPLIRVALANRVVHVRRDAVRALAAWPAPAVPEEAVGWVRQAAAVEPDEVTRDEMAALLARTP
ncbi:hypothetical protein [Nonomuraea africana]|uniref:hypothetical protein n=1 Tax=Nonomuraea africana TaxID=46171 RepID=UPI0033F6ABCA